MCTFALAFEKQSLITQSGCSAVGSALRSGRRGRKFESCHPDPTKIKNFAKSLVVSKKLTIFAPAIINSDIQQFASIAQLVRAPDC